MGKFIQPNGRQAAPIFPQMHNTQRSGAPKPPVENKRAFGDEVKMRTPQPVPNVPTQPKQEMEHAPSNPKKKMTVEDLRNGFKMSIIIGEPVSKKFRKIK